MRSYKRFYRYIINGSSGFADTSQFAKTEIEAKQLGLDVPDMPETWWFFLPNKQQMMEYLNIYFYLLTPTNFPIYQAPLAFEHTLEDPWPLN